MPFLNQVMLSLIYARSVLNMVKVAAAGLHKDHPFKLVEKIVRILGSLVLLEKQKIENDVIVSVAHDKGAHDYVPSWFNRYPANVLEKKAQKRS